MLTCTPIDVVVYVKVLCTRRPSWDGMYEHMHADPSLWLCSPLSDADVRSNPMTSSSSESLV